MEEWRDIKEYEGLYQISNYGRVKKLLKYGKEKIQIAATDKDGYKIIRLWNGNKLKTHKVHRLVATAFLKNPNNYPQVNHKDEDKSNNRVSNLEWMTLKRNINYGTRNKRMALTKGKNVKAFDDDGNFIMGFCSMAVAEKITGISQGDISRCTLGKIEHAGGYVWKIVNHGGASDDVCEWKSASDGEFIQNPHTKRLYSNEPSMQNVYCNTCGKKIKAVE